MRYYFEWDPQKAKINLQKHRISFERACTIFKDPHANKIRIGQKSNKKRNKTI
jgi:uncharacterized DUF497 family protein